MANLIYNLQDLNYKLDVVIPTLISNGMWTIDEQTKYYNSKTLGINQLVNNTYITDFTDIDAMANDIIKTLFK